MAFQALLVSTDISAAETLAPVLSGFGLCLRRCEYAAAIGELTAQRYDALLVDFDDAQRAVLVLQYASLPSSRNGMVAVALLRDPGMVRQVFAAGANFVLYKPIAAEQAQASLRAATALIRRERRRSLRVPVQVPIELRVVNGLNVEGILLDLSEDGLEVLSSQPLFPSASVFLFFRLPGSSTEIQAQGHVAWASPNGQSGVRFVGIPDYVRASLRDWVTSRAHTQPAEEPEIGAPCTLTDMSQGGCYLQTESPFPERSEVILHLQAEGTAVHAHGMVRVMHPGVGMGVEFASSSSEEQDEVANFIRHLLSRPGIAAESLVVPRALAGSPTAALAAQRPQSELDDPLLDLLRGHEAFGQEEFLQRLRSQRRAQAASA